MTTARTLAGELARLARDSEAVRRDQPDPSPPPPFCVVTPTAPVWGPAGTLWLHTGLVGPLGSHPLWVKLTNAVDSPFTHVAWLVLDDD